MKYVLDEFSDLQVHPNASDFIRKWFKFLHFYIRGGQPAAQKGISAVQSWIYFLDSFFYLVYTVHGQGMHYSKSLIWSKVMMPPK
jgi:hypothetical protein